MSKNLKLLKKSEPFARIRINQDGATISFNNVVAPAEGNGIIIHKRGEGHPVISAYIEGKFVGPEAEAIFCGVSPYTMHVSQGVEDTLIIEEQPLKIQEIIIVYLEAGDITFLATVTGVNQCDNGIYCHISSKKKDQDKIRQNFINQTLMLNPQITQFILDGYNGLWEQVEGVSKESQGVKDEK